MRWPPSQRWPGTAFAPARLPIPDGVLARASRSNLLGYGTALAARGLEVAGKFGLYALAATRMGTQESGLFFLALTWATLAATAARLGLERATVRQVAAEVGVGRGLAARRVALLSLAAMTLASVAAALLTVAIARPASQLVFNEAALAGPLLAAALVIPAQNVTWGVATILIGLKRGGAAQLLLSALPSALTLLALLAGVQDAVGLLAAFAAAYLLCAAAGAGLIALDWRGKLAGMGAAEPLTSLWAEARPFFVVEVTQATVLSLPTLLLGVFATPVAVSEFSIASRLSNLVNTVQLSIGTIAAPSFAEHARRREFAALHRVGRQAKYLTLSLGLPAVAAMLFAPGFLLHLLGSAFAAAWEVLVVLALGQMVNCILPFQDTVLAMTGNGRCLRQLNLLQLACCVVLGLVLIPLFGLMGAAVTTALALAMYVVGCAWAVHRLVPR